MFGSLFFERDPLRFKDLGSELTTWTQVFGGVAAVALVVWLILRERGVVRKNAVDVPDWLFEGRIRNYAPPPRSSTLPAQRPGRSD